MKTKFFIMAIPAFLFSANVFASPEPIHEMISVYHDDAKGNQLTQTWTCHQAGKPAGVTTMTLQKV